MSPNTQRLLDEAMRLPANERANLTDALVTAEDADYDPYADPELAAVVKRRLEEIDSGKVKMIPGEQVMQELREIIDGYREL